MAFLKFRLENTRERSAPVPIAAAVSQPSSRQQNGDVQHDSPRRLRDQASSDERIPITPSASHAGKICEHDLGVPELDLTARCSRRLGIHQPDEITHSKHVGPKNRQWRQLRRGSACIECKISKTRCEKSPTAKDKCRRCLRQNKECIRYSSARPSPVEHSGKGSDGPSEEGAIGIDFNSETDPSTAFSMGFTETNLPSSPSSRTWTKQLENKSDSILTPEIAEQVFLQYVTKFAPKCPIVVFPPGTTPAHVQNSKPLLFLSILSVACAGYCPPTKQRELALEVRGCLADTAIVRGEKSLELVQALQVMSFWYRAPDTYTQMIQNQLASISTTMAMDLGLDNLKLASRAQDKWSRLEAQRAWLSCFLLSASLSLILRRPNPTPCFAKLDDYIFDLQRNNASPTDAFLCKLVTTELLCHIIDQELCLSNPVQAVSAPSLKSMAIIQTIQTRIDWLALGQFHQLERSLFEFGRLASSLYIHELALHVNNNIDEFKAPFSAKSLKTCSFVDMQDSSNLSMIRAIIMASQGLLDIFLGFSISEMLTLPPHIYGGRVIYAVILLMKIHKAITTFEKGVSDFIYADNLRLEVYLEQLLITSKCLITEDGRSALSRAFLIMPQLIELFKRPSKADEDLTMGSIPTKTGDGHLDTASPVSTVAPSGSSTAIQALENKSTPGNSRPLDGPVRQLDELIQPAIPPFHPATHSEDTSFGISGPTVASDTWFWEFFNTDMLD
ncbi:uncharacterized protein N7469_002097 [Penicillium citrinum]|uniref:Zn(2)-C6 fungal-type domain-containing protein n=1 Tax=Penicillium citrinum TaxID=5077 RepID=A0A9W9PAK6_PENCI|nr:uncharacterized protein N7469_002097 [Penicillium citrinum]KAJ5240506.1 hypothetical protein N7469_002097 [Penicillium citrinum]